jgi:hypothetical protein
MNPIIVLALIKALTQEVQLLEAQLSQLSAISATSTTVEISVPSTTIPYIPPINPIELNSFIPPLNLGDATPTSSLSYAGLITFQSLIPDVTTTTFEWFTKPSTIASSFTVTIDGIGTFQVPLAYSSPSLNQYQIQFNNSSTGLVAGNAYHVSWEIDTATQYQNDDTVSIIIPSSE